MSRMNEFEAYEPEIINTQMEYQEWELQKELDKLVIDMHLRSFGKLTDIINAAIKYDIAEVSLDQYLVSEPVYEKKICMLVREIEWFDVEKDAIIFEEIIPDHFYYPRVSEKMYFSKQSTIELRDKDNRGIVLQKLVLTATHPISKEESSYELDNWLVYSDLRIYDSLVGEPLQHIVPSK